MRKAAIPAPRKPIHQAPTHSGLSVVSSVLLEEAMVLGLLINAPVSFLVTAWVSLLIPLGPLHRATETLGATALCSLLLQTREAFYCGHSLRQQLLPQTLTARHQEAPTGPQTETLGARPIGDRSFE